jgi:putative cardiolipin synthase
VLAAVVLLFAIPVRADSVRLLCGNHEAIQARVELIQSARAEINVASFAIADDEIGRGFLALLRDASERGVTVRLLVDGLNNHIPPGVQRHLLASGVELRVFHPFSCSHPLWTNRRLHDKLVIVDCCHLIVGSRNLDNRNFGLARRNFVDNDAYVQGCAARDARKYFLCLWHSDEVRPMQPDGARLTSICRCVGKDDGPPCARCALDRAVASLTARGLFALDEPCDCLRQQTGSAEVYFLHDDCGRKNQPNAIGDQLLEALSLAEDTIILESPYLVFSRRLEAVLLDARRRGVKVIILTNSLSSTDQLLVYAAYVNQRGLMLRNGVEFFEYGGPHRLHAKTLLLDGAVCAIGSYNFDPRSEHLNTETAIMTDDRCLIDALIGTMAEHFSNAWQIGPDGNPLGRTQKHPGVGAIQLNKLRAARIMAPLIKRHL